MIFSSVRRSWHSRLISLCLIVTFIVTMVITPRVSYAGGVPGLPEPGSMVNLSSAYVPLMLTGLTVHPENPLLMDFIVSTGNSGLNAAQVKEQSNRLIKYFLACLTIPENDQWVNLSPYEKQRIVPEDLGGTVLGQDMLAQDYLLKQLTASLIYPEKNLGKDFWDKVYAKARQMYGTTQIPVNTFNKVWILPDTAKVYEHKDTVFVVKSHLKVMLDEDYLALQKHSVIASEAKQSFFTVIPAKAGIHNKNDINTLGSQIIRQIILPAIEQEVNHGQNFAQLRQIYNSMILAVWFKKNLKQALLNQVYTDKAKVNGVNADDPAIKEKIYKQYLQAYKKGVFNYIKEEFPPLDGEGKGGVVAVPRKYFSGGITAINSAMLSLATANEARTALEQQGSEFLLRGLTTNAASTINAAMTTKLTNLSNKSDSLVSRMEEANRLGNFSNLNAALEKARVRLPGSSDHNSPYLLAFGSSETPEAVDVTKLSIEEIQQRVAPYLSFPLSTEDAQNLKEQKPFSLEDVSKNNMLEGRLANETRSQQVALIEEAALKAGLLGTRYYVTNIKKFSPNSSLPYMEYLRGLAKEFRGHAVFLLSIEESDKVLLGDLAGMGTAIAAVRKVLGDEFIDTANIDIITDGGKKERAGPPTALNGYNGLFPTAYGITYYRRAMQLLGKVRMQQLDFGKGKVFWTASDGDYQMGNIGYGKNFESDLRNDGSWSSAIHGVAEKIVEDNEKAKLFWEIYNAGDLTNIEDRLKQFPTIKKALNVIKAKKLTELGENFSDFQTGKLVAFIEKATAIRILQMLKKYNTNSIIPNAFLVVYDQKAFRKQQDEIEKVDPNTGKALREFGGSYFDFVIGSQFTRSDPFNNLSPGEQEQMLALHRILPTYKMIAANQGGIGSFTDRGKAEFLVNAYYEEIEANKRKGESGLIKRGVVNVGKNVKLKLARGATAILENVSIEAEGDQQIVVELSDDTFFQNTVLRLNSNTHFGQRTVILNSSIQGKIELQPNNHSIVAEGVIFSPGAVQDFTQDGHWENPQSLQLYSGETVVSILKLDGNRYINRGVTRANYKGEPLLAVFNGQDLHDVRISHPRLGLDLLSVPNSEWITHPNWQGEGTQNVDITSAKPFIDYVKMSQAIKEISAEIKAKGQNAAMTAPTANPAMLIDFTKAGTRMQDLWRAGTSMWLDFISGEALKKGQINAAVENGVLGITSNPAIFAAAIKGSNFYDKRIKTLARPELTSKEIYEPLAVADIQKAANALKRVYKRTNGNDGYISLEIDPTLADDANASIDEGIRLWEMVNRPNLMIKVPVTDTEAGYKVITALLALGINVNVTLLFSPEKYEKQAQAVLKGLNQLAESTLEQRVSGGHDIKTIRSVASFFVSRVDVEVDRRIDELIKEGKIQNEDKVKLDALKALKGKAGIANSTIAYGKYKEIFSKENVDWQFLANRGAAKQRVLWASTGVKNEAYSPTMYVTNLIADEPTVNTAPPDTIQAFVNSNDLIRPVLTGKVGQIKAANKIMQDLKVAGINMNKVFGVLTQEGKEKFVKPFKQLLGAIQEKSISTMTVTPKKGYTITGLYFALAREKGIKAAERVIYRPFSTDEKAYTLPKGGIWSDIHPATKIIFALPEKDRNDTEGWFNYMMKGTTVYIFDVAMTAPTTNPAMTAEEIQNEKAQALLVRKALHTVLNPQSPFAANFLKGGYNQPGYGVAAGAVNDGSFAIDDEGDQGYYVDKTNVSDGHGGYKSGRQVFNDTVNALKKFFERRAKAIGRPLKIIIKTGIGGQHTPFQGIADVFEVIDSDSGKILGEYELGKDWEQSIANVLKIYNAGWDQIAVIPSSKSGSTDETMQIFVEIFKLLLEKIADQKGLNGKVFADTVINYLHEINFDENGKELPGKDLFKKFDMDTLVTKVQESEAQTFRATITRNDVEAVFRVVLGNMFFETTDRPADSRLSAFIRNSGLDKLLGEDAPGFGAMFDNVGGRWTGDLHMMTFLAFHKLDADAYWQARYEGIKEVRRGTHRGNDLGNTILLRGIKKIALVVPDELFWFGKSSEQNFNESIWQEGFANLRAVRASDWQQQAKNYQDAQSLVVNLSDITIGEGFQTFSITSVNTKEGKQVLAQEMARLFTTFYGMTYTVGTRLIARALAKAGLKAEQIDVNDLNNPATKIFQQNLFFRQPFVELGKGLLQKFFEDLQTLQQKWIRGGKIGESPRGATYNNVIKEAQSTDARSLVGSIREALRTANNEHRTFVPFIYLEGGKFTQLRQELVNMGIEWVLQGTGDQHISWQQVLANPDQYYPFIVSFVPSKEEMAPGVPAIGFTRGYLHMISPYLIRYFFAWFSYEALLGQKGKGVFVTLVDNKEQRQGLVDAFKQAVASASPVIMATPHHLSVAELSLLREADEENGFISKRARNDERIKRQIIQIETALGNREGAKEKAGQVIADLNDKRFKFKGEEVHILNGTGPEAKVIGRIDRNIAEKYGYIHETANVVLLTPDGKILLQLRNKDNFDDHLAMYGGHLGVGESHESAIVEETQQETRLESLDEQPIFVGYQSYNLPGDSNKERRSWFVKVLSQREYFEMQKKKSQEESELGISKDSVSRGEYKKALFQIQKIRKDGSGEVVGTYEFTFDQLAQAATAVDKESPFSDKPNHFLKVSDSFQGKEETINAFFSPDSLDSLFWQKSKDLWAKIQQIAEESLNKHRALGNQAMTAGEIRQYEIRLESIISQYQAGNIRPTAKALMEFSDEFNYLPLDGAPEVQKAFNDILVKKSQFARRIALEWVEKNAKNTSGYEEFVSYIKEKGFDSIETFGQKMIDSGAAKKSSIESAIKLTRQLLPEWLDANNNTPYFIIAGIIRGLLEGRSEDILYSFGKDWRMFGTAGIRNQAVQSSFGAIADLELEEFAQDPHALILTGPNLMNIMTIIQQQQAIVNVYREVQNAAREGTLEDLIKEKNLDRRFVDDIINNNKVSIAYDSRLNGKYFAHMLAVGFLNEGIDVDLFDRPSGVPAVVYQAAEDPQRRSAMGILISASHSEANYNGFKAFLSVYRSQVDVAGKNMVVSQRPSIVGEPARGIGVVPYKMHSELGAMSLENFDRVFEKHAKTSQGQGRLKWISDEHFNPTTNRAGADVDDQFFVRYYQHIQALSPAELLDLTPAERELFEAAKKNMKIFYTAFSGGGAVNAQNFPGFLKRMGYENVLINENQTLKHDGRFAGFNRPGGLFGMPDPGVTKGWLVNIIEFLQQEAGENLGENRLPSSIALLNSLMVALATDPDIDRGGILLTLEKGMKGGNIKEPLITAVEEKLISLGASLDHIARVKEQLQTRLNDSLLLTANDAWTFIVFHKLRMMIERGKMSKDKLYIIEKSHATTDALAFVAEYFRNQGYHVYAIDTYVGFTELAKKSRDLFKIAQMSWFIRQHLKSGEINDQRRQTLLTLYSDLEQLNAELKRNVMYDRQGVPLIDEVIEKLGLYLKAGQGSLVDVMSILNIVAHMEIPMGVEESNGYGEFGAFVPSENFVPASDDKNWPNEQVGLMEREHISDKDGSLAVFEFSELLALGKALEKKTPFQMYLDVFRTIGAVGTDNRFVNYVGLTGEDKKLGAMEWFEKTLAVILKKAVDTGKEVTLFNGKYKVKDVQIYRDAKYDVFGIGFPEEGVRLILERVEDGSTLFVTYRPSGTGANNRTYSWVFGAKNYMGRNIAQMNYEELNAYRVNIVRALNELADDFFGIQDKTTGYAQLEKEHFHGLMSALGEASFDQYDSFLGKVIDQKELAEGFTEPAEVVLRAYVEEFGKTLRQFTDTKTGAVNTQSAGFEILRGHNSELWANLMGDAQTQQYPADKKVEVKLNGETIAAIPYAYARGWQTSMIDYLAQLIKERSGSEKVKVTFNDPEVLALIVKRYVKDLSNVDFSDAAMISADKIGQQSRSIARIDGRIIIGVRESGELEVEFKSDGSPKTLGDIKSQKYLDKELTGLIPGSVVINEESFTPETIRLAKEREYTWIVDPLDGTADYIQGRNTYSIGIILLRRGKPVYSLIYAPQYDIDGSGTSLWEAFEDKEGAYFNGKQVSSIPESASLQDSTVLIPESSKYPSPSYYDPFRKLVGQVNSYPGSSLINIGKIITRSLVSDHEALYLKPFPSVWDIFPGAFILLKAGGAATYDNGRSIFPLDIGLFDFRKTGSPRLPSVVLGAPKIHSEALRLIESLNNAEVKIRNDGEMPNLAMLNIGQRKTAEGGIDLNSRNLKMQSEGQKVDITFDPAMIAQFKRGDFSGVKIQILDVVPINLMPLLGLKEDEGAGQLAKV